MSLRAFIGLMAKQTQAVFIISLIRGKDINQGQAFVNLFLLYADSPLFKRLLTLYRMNTLKFKGVV